MIARHGNYTVAAVGLDVLLTLIADGHTYRVGLTPTEARQMALDLMVAADKLDGGYSDLLYDAASDGGEA